MPPPSHTHWCACGAVWVCAHLDCPIIVWTCPACEDEQQADYYRATGYQSDLPLPPVDDAPADPGPRLPLEL